MKFSVAAILLAAASLVAAEEFRVVVGKDKDGKGALVFTPDQVKAKVGDQIHFEFRAKNHTVTQSSFAEPCTRQLNTVTKELGVDSGFMPVAPDAKEIPVWSIEIRQDTAPIWMFCNQGNHCNGGMVFAINAPQEGEKSFSTWKEKAKTATHPKPEDNITADFTPPPAEGSAPPAEGSAPASSSGSAAPTGSDSASAPAKSPAAAPTPASSASATTSGTPTAAPVADQAKVSDPATSSTKSGALSAVRIPGTGVALTLVGLLAGMLL